MRMVFRLAAPKVSSKSLTMRALITGANGQVGWELQRTAPKSATVIALDKQTMDIRNPALVDQVVREHKPDVIINAAAYTAVDKAESERDLAFAINRDGAANIARAANTCGARLIHISTDFVFDGKKSSPYLPTDSPHPLSIYGASKLAGEVAVRECTNDQAVVLRTAWVYSSHGHNFVKTMLRLMKEREQIGVVCDQVGTPTWARGLAEIVWRFAQAAISGGVYHWTDAGAASWYDFAIAIQEEAHSLGGLDRLIKIRPIDTSSYPTPAARPFYSILDKDLTWRLHDVTPTHWRHALRSMLHEVDYAVF